MTDLDVGSLLAGKNRIHFIGIGGSGMFPIVQILAAKGYTITGSDVNEGSIINLEREMGIDVHIGHAAENVIGADAVVVTAALLPGNPEVDKALELNIPIIPRADMLGYLTEKAGSALCVSGTHGKTTTTSLLTSILYLAGRDPSAVIGGKLPLIHGYGLAGAGDEMVVEACEYVDTFLHLSPAVSIILNIDDDHLDYFGSVKGAMKSFRKFADSTRDFVVANGDDANTMEALEGFSGRLITFGRNKSCDYIISDVKRADRAFFSFVLSKGSEKIGEFTLAVPGEHNIINAAASAVTAFELGCTAEDIQKGITSFRGAARRFEFLGERAGVTIADDYAHHPSELRATIASAMDMGYNRVIVVFQPFTYTRTKAHLDAFAEVLSKADICIMTEIMGSREVNTIGIYTADLAAKIPGSVWFNTFREVSDYTLSIAEPGDLVLTMGCGDIYKAAHMMLETPIE